MMRLISLGATFIVFFSLLHNGNSANILGLMGCPSYSHHLWNEVIFKALIDRGHTLTVVSVDGSESPNKNLTYIQLEQTYKVMAEYYQNYDWSVSWFVPNVKMLYDYQRVTCWGILESVGFQQALQLDKKFDLILYDVTTGPCLLRLIQNYPDIPVVGVTAFKMTPEVVAIAGGHNYPSYVPMFINQLEVPMSFYSRLYNTVTYASAHIFRTFSDFAIDWYVSENFPSAGPSVEDLYARMKVVLVNTHPAVDNALSLPPNIVEVGGLHIKEPFILPPDVRRFIENAESGAIFISLGTNLKAENLGEKGLDIFIRVIERFPKYHFLWKVEKEDLLKTVPKNLLIREWFPQNDILGDPRVKVFFTHAGGLSIQEATWHGVPVVAMPFFLDQLSNAYRIYLKGCGVVIYFEELTEELLFESLSEVLTNNLYRDNMRVVQKQFRERPNKPLDEAIWWIEYALKNPCIDHLIPMSRNMSYFVANSLDSLLIGIVLLVMVLVFLRIVFKYVKKGLSKLCHAMKRSEVAEPKVKPPNKKKAKKSKKE